MSDCVKCMRGTNYCQILLVSMIYLSSFFYCRMERKHQDGIVFQNFVMKDNFYIGVLITIIEYSECWCNGANNLCLFSSVIMHCLISLSFISV